MEAVKRKVEKKKNTSANQKGNVINFLVLIRHEIPEAEDYYLTQ